MDGNWYYIGSHCSAARQKGKHLLQFFFCRKAHLILFIEGKTEQNVCFIPNTLMTFNFDKSTGVRSMGTPDAVERPSERDPLRDNCPPSPPPASGAPTPIGSAGAAWSGKPVNNPPRSPVLHCTVPGGLRGQNPLSHDG